MSQYKVFISHSSSEVAVADDVVTKLESNSIKCWIAPGDILAGSDYGAEISAGITNSSVFLLIFSTAANSSKHCLREVELALKSDRVIIPFRIEECAPSGGMEYRLSTVQWIESHNGTLDEKSVAQISGVVGSSIERDSPPKTTPEHVLLNRCSRCGAQYPEHDPSGCSFHPEQPISIGNTGPARDYAEIWSFPCCGQKYVGTFDQREGGISDARPPSSPGCIKGKHVAKFSFRGR